MLKSLKNPIRTLIGIIAVILSVIASVVLIYSAAIHATAWHVVSFSIYGISLITLWTMSTLYHSLNVSKGANRTLEQIDHAMIYFLIAGTYTPICLVVLRGGWGWSLFGINWALAIAGIVLKLIFRRPSNVIIAIFFSFYLIMGWLVIIAWFPLINALPKGGVYWLVLGGVFYTLGAVIFNLKNFKITDQFGHHEIWHLFVLAGSASHFWLMYKYVLHLR